MGSRRLVTRARRVWCSTAAARQALGASRGRIRDLGPDFSPLSFNIHTDYLQPEGFVPQPDESMEISRAIVGPTHFRTLRTSAISAVFNEADTRNSQLVVVVNQAFVDRYWPGEDAIDKQVTDGGDRFTIVGATRNAKSRSPTYRPSLSSILLVTRPIARHMTSSFTTHRRSACHGSSAGKDHPSAHSGGAAVQRDPLSVTMQLGTFWTRRGDVCRRVRSSCHAARRRRHPWRWWLTAPANARGKSASAWRSARRREVSTVCSDQGLRRDTGGSRRGHGARSGIHAAA